MKYAPGELRVVAYKHGDEVHEFEFGQRVAFTQDGTPHLQYSSTSWVVDPEVAAEDRAPLFSEIGYWRLSRPLGDADPGPAMLPGNGNPVFATAEAVETRRNARGAFDIEALIVQPGGLSEL